MRRMGVALLLAGALVLTPVNANAAGVKQPATDRTRHTAAGLVSMKSGMDGRIVEIEGEVISEALSGGEGHVWVNMLSEGVAIGVWMSRSEAEAIGQFGAYRRTGDIVRVTGVFSEACDQHGGDLDVHAEELSVIEDGKPIDRPVSYWKMGLGIAGLAAARAIMRRRREGEPV